MKMKEFCMVCKTNDTYHCYCDKCENCLEKIEYCECSKKELETTYEGVHY
jgi:hypothetical protein